MLPQVAMSVKDEPFLIWCAENLAGEVTYVGRSLVVGRDPESCDVIFNSDLTSRQHANIVIDLEGNALLVDLNSSNGTFVNGTPVQRVRLKEGDRIGFGSRDVVHCVYHSPAKMPPARNLQAIDITEVPTTALDGEAIRCHSCARIVTPGLSVCHYCSADLGRAETAERPGTVKCHSCGASADGDSNFCRRCGTRLIR